MSRRAQENLACAVLLGVFCAVIVMSLDYGPRARMIPLPLATFGIVLVVLQLIWQNLRAGGGLQVDLLQMLTRQAEQAESGQPAERGGARSDWRRELTALGIVTGLVALILLVGPIPAVFLFTAAYFMLSGYCSGAKAIVYTVAFTAAVYALFVIALEMQLYHGILEPLVERFLR